MEMDATRERDARLCVIEDRLRKALRNAPEVRTLFLEWIGLRFQKESLCPKKQKASRLRSSRPK
jgi:hypothetical protein